jgi:hypothetical protein
MISVLIGSAIVGMRTSQIFRDFILVGRKGTPPILGDLKRLGISVVGAEFALFLVFGVHNFLEFSIFLSAVTLQMFWIMRLHMRLRGLTFDAGNFLVFSAKVFLGLFLVYALYGLSLKYAGVFKILPLFKSLLAILFLYVALDLLLPVYIRLFLNPKSIPSVEVGNFLNMCFKRVELNPIETRVVDFGGIRPLDIFVVGMHGAPSFLRPIVLINRDLFSALSAEEFQALMLQKVSRYDQSHFAKRIFFFFVSILMAAVFAKWSGAILHVLLMKKYAYLSASAGALVGVVFLALLVARFLRLQQLQSDVFTVLGYGVSADYLVSGIRKLDELRGPAHGTHFSPDIPTQERGELMYERIYRQNSGKKAFLWNDFLGNLGGGTIGASFVIIMLLAFATSGITNKFFMKDVRTFAYKQVAPAKMPAPQKRSVSSKVIKKKAKAPRKVARR